MEISGSQSVEAVGPVEDPPPPGPQDQSTSESLADSGSGARRPPPPLSPLTGCYLLIVVGEPHSERHKEIILQKIAKAFLSWDVNECHVSLEKELEVITGQSPEGEEARYGERLIQYATENLVTEILIHPQLNTLHQCMKNLLSSFTKHRHIIHAGYTFAGNGSWILQDGTLSISDLIEALHEPEVLRVLKAYENSVSIDVHCAAEGDWKTERFQREPVTKLCSVRVNPGDIMTAGNPAIASFVEYLSPFLEPANIQQLLRPTDVVGNIRFTHPTLYVFPGGQGDAALFGINGFNMLIDGGFARKACFWDFARHLDRLDAVLLTRLNNSTVNGISAVLQRKKMNHVYPQIGHFFCNLQDRKIALSPDGDKDKDSLIVNLAEEGHEIVANLRHLALKPHPCYRDGNQIDPVNLYHKVGHGKLDMYVLSPARDSQAVKEFLAKWTTNDSQLFSNTGRKVGGKAFEFPLQNLVSICALLVWQPANPNDTITRILFPGSTPQHKIFEGLEKLRHLEFLKHPVCTARTTSPSSSTTTRSASKPRQSRSVESRQTPETQKVVGKAQVQKTGKVRTEKTPSRDIKAKVDTNKLAEETKEESVIEGDTVKKLDNMMASSKDEQIENIKKEIQKIEQAAEMEDQKKRMVVHRSKYDMRNVKSKVDSRAPSRSVDRKKIAEKKADGETSPPATPKKTLTNGMASKKEKTMKATTTTAKATKASSAETTPAKSAKEANNRKVVEARMTRSSSKSLTRKKEEPSSSTVVTPAPAPAAATSAAPKADRKPISRRPKGPPSPGKTSKPQSKTDAGVKVSRKPDVDLTVAKAIGKRLAGFPKGAETEKTEPKVEKITAKIESKPVDENEIIENKETDLMAVSRQLKPEKEGKEGEEDEVLEEEEYLIITKEESTEESNKDNESAQEEPRTKDETEGEGEAKKLLREEEESEKKQKPQDEDANAEAEKPDEIDSQNKRDSTVESDKEKHVEEDEPIKAVDDGEEEKESPEEKKMKDLSPGSKDLGDQDERNEFKRQVSKENKEGGESLPEEKISNTLETSATTAPTLPEDEKVDDHVLEEEKPQPEDAPEIVEEKYIQEDTKEDKQKAVPEADTQLPFIPTHVDEEEVPPVSIPASKHKKPRDVVKTPDEVADLPMHEEVDPLLYSGIEFQKKPSEEDIREPKEKPEEENKEVEETSKELKEPEDEPKRDASLTSKYLNIIDELEKSAIAKEPKNLPAQQEGQENDESKPEETDGGTKEAENRQEEVEANLDDGQVGKKTPDKEKIPETEVAEFPARAATDITGESSRPASVTDLEKPIESSGRESPDQQQQSGKSTPKLSVASDPTRASETRSPAERSGKNTPEDVKETKQSSGGSTPLDLKRNASRTSTPEVDFIRKSSGDFVKETEQITGKTTPSDLPVKSALTEESNQTEVQAPEDGVKDVGSEEAKSGKSTPEQPEKELSREPCEKTTPQLHESSGKVTPQEPESGAILEKVPSGQTTPHLHESSGKVTPQEPESGAILEKVPSGQTTPHSHESSGKVTPQEPGSGAILEKVPSGQTTPHLHEYSGKVTPQEPESGAILEKVPSGQTTPHSHESSGKVTPQEPGSGAILEKVSSGQTTPHDLGKSTPVSLENEEPHKLTLQSSGKGTPQDLVQDLSAKSTPKLSGKTTPVDEESSKPSTPQRSGISTPHEDETGKPEPFEARDDSNVSVPKNQITTTEKEGIVPQEVGKSTPSNLEKNEPEPVDVPTSGKSTPGEKEQSGIGPSQKSGNTTPSGSGREAIGNLTPQESGKTTPTSILEKDNKSPGDRERLSPQDLEKKPSSTSGKTTPCDLEREVCGVLQSQDDSRTSTPRKLSDAAKPTKSGLKTPIESGKTTPVEKVAAPEGSTEKMSGKSSPSEKEPSGASTPQKSRTITPTDSVKDVTTTLESSGREKSSSNNVETETNLPTPKDTETIPLDLEKEADTKSILQVSGTPSDLHGTTQDNFVTDTNKSTPKEQSRTSTPQSPRNVTAGELDKVTETKTTPETSRIGTPQDLGTVTCQVSPLPSVTDKEEYAKSPSSSGKSSPSEKENSGTSTIQNVRASTPQQEKGRSPEPEGQTKQENTTFRSEDLRNQGQVTPVEKMSPQPDIEKSAAASGKCTPEDLTKPRVSTPVVVDGESERNKSPTSANITPRNSISKCVPSREGSDKRTSPEVSIDVVEHITVDSRRSSQASEREELRKLEEWEKSEPGKSKQQEEDKTDQLVQVQKDASDKTKLSDAEDQVSETETRPSSTVDEKAPMEKEGTQDPKSRTQSPSTTNADLPEDQPQVQTPVDTCASEIPIQKDKGCSGKSTPVSSPPISGKPTSDSVSMALAEKGTSATCTSEKESLAKSSSPSPVDISPLSLDEIKEASQHSAAEPEVRKSPRSKQGRRISEGILKNPLERIKYEEGDSSRSSTPDRSTCDKSDSSALNDVESEEEMEKGTLESERQEKESQILDVSSAEEEELKALNVDDDSDEDVKKEREELDGTHTDIRKDEKEDMNQLVKIGIRDNEKETGGSGNGSVSGGDNDEEQNTGVKRMLVTASSEDGGTETEICIQSIVKTLVVEEDEEGSKAMEVKEDEDEGDGEEFSNLILQARQEYNSQRARKTPGGTPIEETEDLDENASIDSEMGSEREELGTLVMQARQELAFVRSRSREETRKEDEQIKMLRKTKTTKTTETTRQEGNEMVTVTTTVTEEREEQEDGTIKVTTKTETTTRGGKEEGTTVRLSTFVEPGNATTSVGCEEEMEKITLFTSGRDYEAVVAGESGTPTGKTQEGEDQQGGASRRTSTASVISQEDLMCRKDSAKMDDFRRGSSEMSPLKTTYITSHGDSESLMTSSFYGNLPMEDEIRAEHLRAYRKARGYESVTEIGPNGEKMERTYFYGPEDSEPVRVIREKSRFVKTFYTEENQPKGEEHARYVHAFYSSDIPEEEGELEKPEVTQRFHREKVSGQIESDTYRFVKASFPEEEEGAEENLDFAKAVEEHVSVRGDHLGKEFQQSFTTAKSTAQTERDEKNDSETSEQTGVKKDVIEGWGKPLGLPLPPKHLNKAYAFPGQNISTTSSLSTPSDNSDSVTNWGQPMSLPSPAPPSVTNTLDTLPGKTGRETPRKEKLQMVKSGDSKGSGSNTPNRRSQSPAKPPERRMPSAGRGNRPGANSHLYLDLTYVPHHGNSYYINVEFFKKIRARYYVFSGTEPSKEVYNALLEAKQTWEDKNLEVTIIPTYDTDILGYWVAENEETLAKHKIDLSPSASRCTINLQDHETSCSAYRLEF